MTLLINKKGNNQSGYSLLEILITLSIVSILTIMLSNIMLIGIRSSMEIQARSSVREDLTTVANMIKKDIRNANILEDNCINIEGSTTCSMTKDAEIIMWQLCGIEENQICKKIFNNTTQEYDIAYRTSPNTTITTLNFEEAFVSQENAINPTVIITLIADHSMENLNIKNLYRQFLISPRTYAL